MSSQDAVTARRTWLDSARDVVVDLIGWFVLDVDWLTTAAWVLTLGCLGCAILDSYTSLCVVGGSLAKVGSASACFEFGGWDTRVFPLAVDMGWGGALFAVLRLARTIGLKSWRWWVVLSFEALTAAFTIAGNAFHGAVESHAVGDIGVWALIITCVASAVPGVTAVGSGFTLSVLVSSRQVSAPEPHVPEDAHPLDSARAEEPSQPLKPHEPDALPPHVQEVAEAPVQESVQEQPQERADARASTGTKARGRSGPKRASSARGKGGSAQSKTARARALLEESRDVLEGKDRRARAELIARVTEQVGLADSSTVRREALELEKAHGLIPLRAKTGDEVA